MTADIVTREDGRVLGITARVEPTRADYGRIWREGFAPHEAEIAAHAAQAGYYGVYFGTGEPDKVDFLAGMMVTEAAQAGEELVLRPVPGGRYAKFVCALPEIGASWQRIYGEWLPRSAFEEDSSRPCMEYFQPERPVEIYLPIRDRNEASP